MKIFALLALSIVLTKGIMAQNTYKTRINHTAIFVVDVQKSGWFYHNIIGLDTIPEPFHDGRHIWMRTGEHSALHIIGGADKPKEYFLDNHTCFSVASVTDFIELLKRNNISWQDVKKQKYSITTRVDGVHQIWLQDPDGYWIEINDDHS
jgi:lactoylglutathione lyase